MCKSICLFHPQSPHLEQHHRGDFPALISYNCFVQLMPRVMLPLFAFLQTECLAEVTGISFMDSAALQVNDTLKNVCLIEHFSHRSAVNFLVHLISGLIAYTQFPNKPAIKLDFPAEYGMICVA